MGEAIGLLKWVDESGNDGEKVLHINQGAGWVRYNHHVLAKPDTVLPNIRPSKGFATAQYLLSRGFVYEQ